MLRRLEALRWAGVLWIVVFWRLGYASLMDPDEAHYAQLTREMLQAGNWLVPLLDGTPFIDKPVLFHWLQGAAFTILGESEFAARLPTGLAAVALFGIVRWVGLVLFGATVGEWGAIMFATVPATFALASIGLLDMVYTTFLFGAVGCLLVAARQGRPSIEWTGYALLALAVMTKGPVALVLVAVFCGAAVIAGGELREGISRLHWKTGLAVAAVAAAPWFAWMYVRFGDAFVQGYLLAGNLYYLTQPASFSGRAVSHIYYARVVAGAFFPWSVIAAGRAIDLLMHRGDAPSAWREEKLLWLWAATVVGLFSLARFKLDHYIFPAAPAVCLIAAKAWHEAAAGASVSRATRVCVIGLAGVLVLAGTFTSVYLFELNLELPEGAILLPVVLALGGMALLGAVSAAGWQVPRTPQPLVITLLLVYAAVVSFGFPTLEHTRPTALVATTLREKTPADAPAGLYRVEQWRASLRYYAGRPLARLTTPEELAAFAAAQPRPVYIFMIRREYRSLREAMGLREVFRRRAVVGTVRAAGGLRRQQWDDLIIVTNAPAHASWLP